MTKLLDEDALKRAREEDCRRRRVRKASAWIGGIVVLLFVSIVTWPQWSALWPGSGASRQNPKTLKYFRVVASYVYKGEPVKFEVVAECRYWTDKYISESIARSFRVPYLYGGRMKDNAALFMAVPHVCFVDLDDDVNEQFIPLTFLAEDADDLSLFTAYTSDVGYTWPDEKLKFVSARITKAAEEERVAWLSSGVENVITVENDPWQNRNRRPGETQSPVTCHGALRLAISEEHTTAVTTQWPDHRPRFWRPEDTKLLSKLIIKQMVRLGAPHRKFDIGVLRTDGTGYIYPKGKYSNMLPMAAVPLILPFGRPFLTEAYKTSTEIIYTYNIGDGTRTGQALCYLAQYNFKQDLQQYPGTYAQKTEAVHLVDGKRYSGDFIPAYSAQLVFEKDKYIVWFFTISGTSFERGRME